MVYYLFQDIIQSDLRENQLSIQPLLHRINKLTEYNFLYLTPRGLKILLVKFLSIIAKLKSNEPVVVMIIHYEYKIVYIYRQLMIELSICDICNMPIAILINFLFLFFFFFFLLFLFFFFFLLAVEMFCVM